MNAQARHIRPARLLTGASSLPSDELQHAHENISKAASEFVAFAMKAWTEAGGEVFYAQKCERFLFDGIADALSNELVGCSSEHLQGLRDWRGAK